MFTARIRVNEDTDIGAEVEHLLSLGRKHGLNEVLSFALARDAENILSELKRQHDEAAPHGIQVSLTKSLTTTDYNIVFDLGESHVHKGSLFSRLFGK